jgi:hypothetical protein
MLGLFKKTPKLEATFAPTTAVARELAREIEVAGELVVRNVGRDAALSDLALILIAGGTRRIDLALPSAWRGSLQIAAGGELRQQVAWKQTLAAPMRAPAAQVQVITTAGGKHQPLAITPPFPLANE